MIFKSDQGVATDLDQTSCYCALLVYVFLDFLAPEALDAGSFSIYLDIDTHGKLIGS